VGGRGFGSGREKRLHNSGFVGTGSMAWHVRNLNWYLVLLELHLVVFKLSTNNNNNPKI